MKYCVQIISFNPLASNLYKYITKLFVFNLMNLTCLTHSYDILGARMLCKPKEARILTNFIDQPM